MNPPATPFTADGGCDCGQLRYRISSRPLFVHCCHCRWCQRESGASFALNAMIESDRLQVLQGVADLVDTPSASGLGQQIARCPRCRIALWSHYAGAGPARRAPRSGLSPSRPPRGARKLGAARRFLGRFVRVGTLDEPDRLPPDIHIFTRSKQPWVVIPEGAVAVEAYYERERHWPPESLARREALRPHIEAWLATRGKASD